MSIALYLCAYASVRELQTNQCVYAFVAGENNNIIKFGLFALGMEWASDTALSIFLIRRHNVDPITLGGRSVLGRTQFIVKFLLALHICQDVLVSLSNWRLFFE